MRKLSSLLLLAMSLACAGCDDPQPPEERPAHWEISSEYVFNTMLKSDLVIADALKDKQILRLRARDLPPGVYDRYRAMAGRMRLHPLPALYLDALDARPLPQAAARFTQQGHALVVVNPAALNMWSARELVAVLGHELVHLKERHVTAENLAAAFNHPELSVAHEFEADRAGSGPLGSCDPEALKSALQITFDTDRENYAQANPDTVQDYDSLPMADHPDRARRLAALDAMAADGPPGCE